MLQPDVIVRSRTGDKETARSPLQLACQATDNAMCSLLMHRVDREHIWIHQRDLISLARTFPERIAPYLEKMGTSSPPNSIGGERDETVCHETQRFPMQRHQTRIVSASNKASSFKRGHWAKRKKAIKQRWSVRLIIRPRG